MRRPVVHRLLLPAVAVATLAACGSDDGSAGAGSGDVTIAVTTSILGDVVGELVGDLGEVVTIMPRGANAHDFQASAREAAVLAGADAIVVNGGGLEAGLGSVIGSAADDGVPVIDAVAMLDDVHEDEEVAEEEDGHEHDGDAHFFTDPLAVAEVVPGLARSLAEEVPDIDAAALDAQADRLVDDLGALHAELESTLAEVPEDRRVLVTDHDVLGSFAARYDFEVVATVIPTGSTADGVSGGALADLATVLRSSGVGAVFTEATASAELADTLADEVGDVVVVPLHAESLGPVGSEAATYASMMRVNARRIADALGG